MFGHLSDVLQSKTVAEFDRKHAGPRSHGSQLLGGAICDRHSQRFYQFQVFTTKSVDYSEKKINFFRWLLDTEV